MAASNPAGLGGKSTRLGRRGCVDVLPRVKVPDTVDTVANRRLKCKVFNVFDLMQG
jgi:hypothetical protein